MADDKTQNEYFAAKDAKDTANILMQKAGSFYTVLESNRYFDKLEKMYRAYHGQYQRDYTDGHDVTYGGEQGEFTLLPVNHFRNIAQHIYVMITANRPIMEARAINTDYKSLAQAHLANGILDYYMREKGLESALKKAAEMAIVMGAGFIKMEWNATAGEQHDFDEETGQFVYEGEIEFSNLSPFDVVFDGTKEDYNQNQDWVMVRSFQNKYNLMAKYPELADKIKGIPTKSDTGIYKLRLFTNDETDDIPVYEFYHKRTEAMPEGRYILFSSPDTVYLDNGLPYRQVPIFRISPADFLGTPYGYSPMFDLFPIQECINSLYSTIMTNQNAFGVQNVYVPRGADLSMSSLEGAMNIIEGNAKPESLNLTETPAEVYKFLDMLISAQETLSGVNSVSRGNPEASLKSGTALALVQSMSLQFISGLQQSYVKLIEDTGTALINILKDFANTPKVVALVGKYNKPLLKEFTGESLSAINRVVVDMGNPLSRTMAGRVQMAEQLLQMNLIKNPQQYFQVMNTGRLDSMFEGEEAELLLIKAENEKIMDGEAPLVSPMDKHSIHIMEHKAVLADPDLRSNPDLVRLAMDHVEEHLRALRETDPAILQMIGEQPLPPVEQMVQGMQGAAAQGGQMAPPQGAPQPSNEVLQGSPAPEMMAPNSGQVAAGQQIQGPGVENVGVPGLPQVDAQLLPNPELQEQSMNNIQTM